MNHHDNHPISALAFLRAREVDPRCAVALQAHYRERIAQAEPHVRAWRELDIGRFDAPVGTGLLAGVPVGVKDIMLTQDFPTRYGSSLYEAGAQGEDAACVARTRQAGAIVLGKTVTTEFAYFTPGPTANPHDTRRTPGGSSSGSAAAVAAGMVPLALGSQTAGSLIRPASYCGVFALKPSHGEFDLAGVKAMAPSLDTLGWLANSADDLELLRAVLTGQRFGALPALWHGDIRLGLCRTHEWRFMQPGGEQLFELGAQRLAKQGVRIVEHILPHALAGLSEAQKCIQAYEAARAFEADWQRGRASMSPALRELIETGQRCPRQTYESALTLALAAARQFADWSGDFDALLVPGAPGEAPLGLEATGDPVFSRVWTLLGLPCVNVPGLYGPNDMPFGLQLVGAQGSERHLLVLARHLHEILDEGN